MCNDIAMKIQRLIIGNTSAVLCRYSVYCTNKNHKNNERKKEGTEHAAKI